MNHYFVHSTLIGDLILEANLNYLVRISFNRKYLNRIKACSIKKNLTLEKKVEQLDEYFFNNRKFFTINYILKTTWFFKKVLEEVSLIKFGEVMSYKQIVRILKNKKRRQ